MEIRDPIRTTILLSPAEDAIVKSSAYQRLRFIKQLGFSEFSFPGATHNRFLHSLGVFYLSGLCFDSIFKNYKFKSTKKRQTYRSLVGLAALLHDIGHGPLSHTTEEVMPHLKELCIPIYDNLRTDIELQKTFQNLDRSADHEDYSIKFITHSDLTKIISDNYPDFSPTHVACLINKNIQTPDKLFTDGGVDFRPVLSQIISSELDADRLDYLERDAYFCGTNYGRIETNWLIDNMSFYVPEGKNQAFLSLNRRALYSFDDFLLARHHMHLMVYFHHKSIIYEELLLKYLKSDQCNFYLPSDIDEYTTYSDSTLFEHLVKSPNHWAQRVGGRKPYQVLFELHSTEDSFRIKKMEESLEKHGIPTISAHSKTRLSKYQSLGSCETEGSIYVIDQYDRQSQACPIEKITKVFQQHEAVRQIERLYVPPEDHTKSEQILINEKL